MASNGVSEEELGELASLISSPNMYQIGIMHLSIETGQLDSLKAGARENQWKFTFDVLNLWKNKMMGNATKRVSFFSKQ